MLQLAVLFLLASCVVSKSIIQPRINGGSAIEIEDAPWQVIVERGVCEEACGDAR